MRKPSIPQVRAVDPHEYAFLTAVKDNIEQLTGVKGGAPLQPLPLSATTEQIVGKINEIVARLNYSA